MHGISPRHIRLAAVAAFAALVLAALAWTAGAAWAQAAPAVTLETSATSVTLGSQVRLSGVVSDPVDGSRSVAVLERVAKRWKNVGTTELSADGTFTLDVTPSKAGPWRVLAQYRAGKTKVRSGVLVLDVREAPSAWLAGACGGWGTAALAADGTLWAWGGNDQGQLGLGTVDEDPHPAPSEVSTDTAWAAVSAGADHTLALKKDGTLWAWGGDREGQLGLGETTATVSAPVQVDGGHDWAAVSAGRYFSVALKKDGTLWSWGVNANGQLGVGDGGARTSPTQVGIDADWAAVSAGQNHAMALKKDGSLWGWGFNGNGQLGTGDTRSRIVPTEVGGDTTSWEAVSCGNAVTLAISTGGELLAWGYNGNGQLGLGDAVQRVVPTRIGTRTDWTAISAGTHHTLALRADGTLWAFGWGGDGQLGVGGTDDSSSPVQVGSDTDWTAISTGADFSLGLKKDGTLWTWGDNGLGQLGLGDTDQHDAPAEVATTAP